MPILSLCFHISTTMKFTFAKKPVKTLPESFDDTPYTDLKTPAPKEPDRQKEPDSSAWHTHVPDPELSIQIEPEPEVSIWKRRFFIGYLILVTVVNYGTLHLSIRAAVEGSLSVIAVAVNVSADAIAELAGAFWLCYHRKTLTKSGKITEYRSSDQPGRLFRFVICAFFLLCAGAVDTCSAVFIKDNPMATNTRHLSYIYICIILGMEVLVYLTGLFLTSMPHVPTIISDAAYYAIISWISLVVLHNPQRWWLDGAGGIVISLMMGAKWVLSGYHGGRIRGRLWPSVLVARSGKCGE